MNGYVNGNNACKYENNCIELERARRWAAHRRVQMEMRAAEVQEANRCPEENRTRRLLVVEMILRCATAVLLLVPMCIETMEAWNVLWLNGFRGHLSELLMLVAGVVLSLWILGQAARRTEEIMDEIAPDPEEEVGWR